MNITAIDTPIEHQVVDFIVLPHFENTDKLNGSANKLDTLLNQSISKLIADAEVTGKVSETTTLYTYGAIKAKKILLVGLGSIENCDLETIRTVFGKLTSNIKVKAINKSLICLDSQTISKLPQNQNKNQFIQAVVEGLILGAYAVSYTHLTLPTKA